MAPTFWLEARAAAMFPEATVLPEPPLYEKHVTTFIFAPFSWRRTLADLLYDALRLFYLLPQVIAFNRRKVCKRTPVLRIFPENMLEQDREENFCCPRAVPLVESTELETDFGEIEDAFYGLLEHGMGLFYLRTRL